MSQPKAPFPIKLGPMIFNSGHSRETSHPQPTPPTMKLLQGPVRLPYWSIKFQLLSRQPILVPCIQEDSEQSSGPAVRPICEHKRPATQQTSRLPEGDTICPVPGIAQDPDEVEGGYTWYKTEGVPFWQSTCLLGHGTLVFGDRDYCKPSGPLWMRMLGKRMGD